MNSFCASLLLALLAAHLVPTNEAAKLLLNGASASASAGGSSSGYFGSLIGKLEGKSNNVSGLVYAVDEQTIFIRQFNYDGLAPDTYFWSSVIAREPSADSSFIVPDEKGSTKPLERYANKDLVLRLPEGKTLREIHWLSVWSRARRESLAHLQLLSQGGPNSAPTFSTPRPLEIAPFTQSAHGLRSGPITIVDAQTFLVPDFHYDGLGPDAFFWLARGSQGLQAAGLKLKDENGNSGPLRKYSGETVVISLPDELTIYDFDYFGVWCKKYGVEFGHTKIPQNARVPPSPKMLGIKPENKLNCEILYDELGFEIRWVLDGDDIVMQLVGKIEPGEYMAFGLGKDDARSDMEGADAAVAWVDHTSGQVHAVDYYLGSKQQCSTPELATLERPRTGSCPDSKLPGGGDSLTLLHGAIVNGYSMVTFKRPQLGVDDRYDQHVYSDGQQSILWAIGALNSRNEIGYHRLRARNNLFIDFARHPQWNCPVPDLNATMHSQQLAQPVAESSSIATSSPAIFHNQPESAASFGPNSGSSSSVTEGSLGQSQQLHPTAESAISVSRQQAPVPTDFMPMLESTTTAADPAPWFIPSIVCPQERTLYAQIGPTGGKRGFEGVTGRQSWGVAWYVNGLMVPELVLERGSAYRFVVEGGNDKTSNTRRHPFYLTDSSEGGFDFKTDDQRLKERIFAGVGLRADGQFVPTAEGRLCEWKQTNQTLANPDSYPSFAAFQRSLKLECLPGQASMLKFTPDTNTPDLIYYQCYTHPHMGWRIRIVDSCNAYLSGSTGMRTSGTVGGQQRVDGGSVGAFNNISKRDLSGPSPTSSGDYQNQNYERRSFSTSASILGVPSIERQGFSGNLLQEPSALDENSIFPSDMLIVNSSLLGIKQPLNLSSFDEVLKLSPGDLEFIDKQPVDSAFEAAILQANLPFGSIFPITLNNFTQQAKPNNKQPMATSSSHNNNNRTFARQAKTLQAYIRRLASIYYPVQQQLANMLSNQQQQPPNTQTTTASSASSLSNSSNKPGVTNQSQRQNQQQQLLPSASEQASSFSLSSLVPKPKIDLSKSGISKKLNKFRFKSNKQPEQQTTGATATKQAPSQPPTPAIEFNYDIFNNQLAELEKHNKQLQDLELLTWPQQHQQHQQLDSLNYMPMLTAASADQPELDGFMNGVGFMATAAPQQQTQYLPPLSSNLSPSNMFQHLAQSPQQLQLQLQQQQRQQYPQQTRPAQQQHNHMLDYLAIMFNNNNNSNRTSNPQHDSGRIVNQHYQQQQQFQQQPAIYVARVPVPVTAPFPPHLQQFPSRPAQWPAQSAMHQQYQQYPQQQQPLQHPTWPSAHLYEQQAVPTRQLSQQQALVEEPAESLSGSGSGSHYDFRQQPRNPTSSGESTVNSSAEQEDHIVAMERYSKQPSERQPVSVVHPVTGEQINNQQYQQTSSMLSSHRYNHQNKQLAPGDRLSEPLDAQQTTQVFGTDLHRVNANSTEQVTTQQSSSQQVPTTSYPLIATTTTSSPKIEASAGPLIPSLGPPAPPPRTNEHPEHEPELVLKSTLIEPTIITGSNLLPGSSQPTNFISPSNYETSPFTPIELVGYSNSFHSHSHPYPYQRLRPSPLVESMMAQHLNPFRPKPPVQVASYLSQHLINQHHHQQQQQPQLMSAASEKSQVTIAGDQQPGSSQQESNGDGMKSRRNNQSNNEDPSMANELFTSNELIILKPAITRSNSKSQTYMLRPEYLTHQVTQVPSSTKQQHQLLSPDHELYYTAPASMLFEGTSRLLAGHHQFERLSSLSSPPSTSITLDPLQMANSQNSHLSNAPVSPNTISANSSAHHSQLQVLPSSGFESASSSINLSKINNYNQQSIDNSSSSGSSSNSSYKFVQHRQNPTPVALGFEDQAQASVINSSPIQPDAVSSYSQQDSSSFNRNIDNNTDNAILSHVMSLIQSNAIPTPPLIPVSTYSNADYFMPISDRIQRSIRG